jgi:class 3 adenylate cyclase/tetratricopeptide (TPR) repeat protein
VLCSKCGTANEAGRKFCKECAAPLAVICPSCGSANAPDAKFCGECATPLAAGAPPRAAAGSDDTATTAAAPVAERRLVSVLFADLVGFTPFAESRDSEEVRETLSRYFDIAREIVERYGGTIEKFIGDAVMAVWGTPIAREDDAERAVRAALDLLEAVPVLGEGIRARAGVLTGEAAVTLGATGQGMVAGDIVNTAARLQGVAEPGTVLVGETTKHAASGAIVFEAAGPTELKGKASPVPAFRAVRVVAQRGGRNRSESLEAPFVGREEELRLLKEAFHATGREQRPRLVSIVGPAGIGKSRLTWEFLKYLDGLVEEVWYQSGRSPSYGEGISFWALGEMIRARAGLAETDDEATTRTRVAEMVATHVPDEAERRGIEPAMLQLLGAGETQEHSDELFAAWRTFFERMSLTGTTVLVFEDLHWADAGLLDFIDHVLEWTRELPILIVTLARPELLDKRPNWGAGKRHFSSVFLEPLPEAAMRQLLAGLVPGLPDAAAAAIVARADGVPLYAVETVRMLVGDGRLTEQDGIYVPSGDLSELAVPDTLTALISARLDALDHADRALLQDAAVLGQSFTADALSAVAGQPPNELEPRLRSLVRRELLILRADPRAPDRGQYAFVQSLIREVAYNTLARKDRKTRHLAAARYFESLETDELVGALAGHYLAAYQNAGDGPDAATLAAQARVSLKAAADRASSLGSHVQALRFLEQALDVTADEVERADLSEAAGRAAEAADLVNEASTHLRAARDIRLQLGDRVGSLRAITVLVRTIISTQAIEQALSLIDAARNEFADLVDDSTYVRLQGQLARAHFFNQEYQRAVEIADEVLAAAERANLVDVLLDTIVTKGTALVATGRNREGVILITGAGTQAEASGLPMIALRAYINGSIAETLVDPRLSLEKLRIGLKLAARLGRAGETAPLSGNAAIVAMRTGEWTWAEEILKNALANAGSATGRLMPLVGLAQLADYRGQDSSELVGTIKAEAIAADTFDARVRASEADASVAFVQRRFADARRLWVEILAAGVPDPEVHLQVVEASLWMRDPALASKDLAAARATGAFGRAIEAGYDRMAAGIAALEGRAADALGIYRRVLRDWRELGLPWDEALTGLDMATFLDPSDAEVRQAAENARKTFVELDAKPFLALLDEALARTRGAKAEARTSEGVTSVTR